MDTAEVRMSFEEFVRARSASLGRSAYLLTGDRHHAEDLLQSALVRAAVRGDGLDDPEAYVRRILYTHAVSWWRRLRRQPPETLTEAPTHASNPAADVETRLVMEQALARLTAKQRAVLVLRFYEDQTEQQTAILLGCAVGTVKSQTRYALARLRTLNPELVELVGATAPIAAVVQQ